MSPSSSSELSEKARITFTNPYVQPRKSRKAGAGTLEKIRFAVWSASHTLGSSLGVSKTRKSKDGKRRQAIKHPSQSRCLIACSNHTRTLVEADEASVATPSDAIDARGSLQQCLNFATGCPSGFNEFEHDTALAIQHAVTSFTSPQSCAGLQTRVQARLAQDFGFGECYLTSSLSARDNLALDTVTSYARSVDKPCIVLTGRPALKIKPRKDDKTVLHAFKQHNLRSLGAKLKTCHARTPDAVVCVFIESLSSQDGRTIDLPQLMALKAQYGFLLILDESRSFLGIGPRGRGINDYYSSKGLETNEIEIDIVLASLNSVIGANGGVLLTRTKLSQAHQSSPNFEFHQVPPPAVLLRLVNVLEKSNLIRHRMRLLTKRSNYIRDVLQQSALEVLSSPGSPYISVVIGSPRQTYRLVEQARARGLLVGSRIPQDKSRWRSTIELTITATISWKDIRYLVETLTWLAVDLQVCGALSIPPDPSVPEFRCKEPSSVIKESVRVNRTLWGTVDRMCGERKDLGPRARQGLARYGMSAPSLGGCIVFEHQVALERQLSSLYSPLLTGSCATPTVVTFPEHTNTLCDTLLHIPTLTLPSLSKYHTHDLYVYAGSSLQLTTKLKDLTQQFINVNLQLYVSTHDLLSRLASPSASSTAQKQRSCATKPRNRILTVYIQTSFPSPASRPAPREFIDLNNVLASVTKAVPYSQYGHINLILDDSESFGALGDRQLGVLDYSPALEKMGSSASSQTSASSVSKTKDFAFPEPAKGLVVSASEQAKAKVKVFLCAAFAPVRGVQGGFLVGERDVIMRLRERETQDEKERMSAWECGIVGDWLHERTVHVYAH